MQVFEIYFVYNKHLECRFLKYKEYVQYGLKITQAVDSIKATWLSQSLATQRIEAKDAIHVSS